MRPPIDGFAEDIGGIGTGTVAEVCEVSRCRQPAWLRHCGVSMCGRHWDEECERLEAQEAADGTQEEEGPETPPEADRPVTGLPGPPVDAGAREVEPDTGFGIM